jgi:DNA polymerase sigma
MAGTPSVVDGASETRTRQAKKGNKMKGNGVTAEVVGKVGSAAVAPSLCEQLAHLEKDVVTRLDELMPTAASSALAERCLQELRLIVRQLGPEWDALPFGSYANGFGTAVSDLDVVFSQGKDAGGTGAQCLAASVLGEKIVPMLQRHLSFSVVKEILGARVPIVKLCFEGNLEVDISCFNPQPLLNTKLLSAYSRIDSRIQRLGVAVKLWARGAGVCDATKKNLSSYSFTLLALYFLQVHPEVRLPVLPEDIVRRDAASVDECVASAAAASCCGLSLSQLLALFFTFYANDFKWGTEVVCIRLGQRRMVHEPVFSRLRGNQVERIHIEDPIQFERNLSCVLGADEEVQLRAAFCAACNDVVNGTTPAGLQPGCHESFEKVFDLVRTHTGDSGSDSGTTADVSGRTSDVTASSEDEGSADSHSASPKALHGDALPAIDLCKRSGAFSGGMLDCATLERMLGAST